MNHWPRIFCIPPAAVLGIAAAIVLGSWTLVILMDVLGVLAPTKPGILQRLHNGVPMYFHLFNDRPVEWSQWPIMAATVLGSGYLAGRLEGGPLQGARTFFLLFGAGVGLMLIEEAGDIRHTITDYVRLLVGWDLHGIPPQVLVDVPYFALLAVLPVWAVLGYGRHIWRAPAARAYLVGGVCLYAVASVGSALLSSRHYTLIGSWIDHTLMGGRLAPIPGELGEDGIYYIIFVDGAIEESIELMAATCFLCVVLAYVRELRAERLPAR